MIEWVHQALVWALRLWEAAASGAAQSSNWFTNKNYANAMEMNACKWFSTPQRKYTGNGDQTFPIESTRYVILY